MKTLLRIIYTSRASIPFDDVSLNSLLDQARSSNYHAGITGVLSFGHGFFLQVLEGPEARLISLYSKILNDRRHRDCQIIDMAFTHQRLFCNWTMGFVGEINKIGQSYNEIIDYRVVREDLAETRFLLDSLLEIVRG